MVDTISCESLILNLENTWSCKVNWGHLNFINFINIPETYVGAGCGEGELYMIFELLANELRIAICM